VREVTVEGLSPEMVTVGEGFNVQADGLSALAVRVRNATRSSVIMFDGTPLDTVFASSGLLTAKVPAGLVSAPGRYPVRVADGATISNTVDFVVNAR
jgi:hypothetical protein